MEPSLDISTILQYLDQDSIPYSPQTYPPAASWHKLKDEIPVKRAWQKTLQNPGRISAQVSFPFCASICNFCAQPVRMTGSSGQIEAYVDALCREMNLMRRHFSGRRFFSVRFGGGTPCLLSADQLERIFKTFFESFKIEPGTNIAVEANPEFVDEEKLGVLNRFGVNWLVLGLQSLDDNVLKLNRCAQKAHRAERVCGEARKAGIKYVAVDLMCGLPGQGEESFLKDVRTVSGWRPDRISLYAFSPGMQTPFFQSGGVLPPQHGDSCSRAVQKGFDIMREKGYLFKDQYSPYWGVLDSQTDEKWPHAYETGSPSRAYSILGLGLGAQSYACRTLRYRNTANLSNYLRASKSGNLPADTGRPLSTRDEMINFVLLSLDCLNGISGKEFRQAFGQPLEEAFGAELSRLAEKGILKRNGSRYDVLVNRDRSRGECRKAFFEKWVVEQLSGRYAGQPGDDEQLANIFSLIDGEKMPYEQVYYPPRQSWESLDEKDVLHGWKELSREGVSGMYIHIPFCENICSFCGFYAIKLGAKAQIEQYLQALQKEMAILGPLVRGVRFSQVCMGGGTPSLLTAEQFQKLFDNLNNQFDLTLCRPPSPPARMEYGIEVECHPDDLDLKKLETLQKCGVTHLALGIQSLDDKILKANNRLQDNSRVPQVYEMTRKAGIRHVAVEMMCGLKGQGEESFLKDIKTVSKWRPDRIFIYDFQPKVRTCLPHKGYVITPRGMEQIRAMREKAFTFLQQEGYRIHGHFAILTKGGANWPDSFDFDMSHRSILGLGLGAISHVREKLRYQNTINSQQYIRKLKSGNLPVEQGCSLRIEHDMRYFILDTLSCETGQLDRAEFEELFKEAPERRFGQSFQNLMKIGALEKIRNRYFISDRAKASFHLRKEFYEESALKSLMEKYKERLSSPLEQSAYESGDPCRPRPKRGHENIPIVRLPSASGEGLPVPDEFADAGLLPGDSAKPVQNAAQEAYSLFLAGHRRIAFFAQDPSVTRMVPLARKLGYRDTWLLSDGTPSEIDAGTWNSILPGLAGLCAAVHGHRPACHDAMVSSPGAYNRILKIIEAALPTQSKVLVIYCLNAMNYRSLPEGIDYFTRLGVKHFTILFPCLRGMLRPAGGSGQMQISMAESAPYVGLALERLKEKSLEPPRLNHFLPCLVKDRQSLMEDVGLETFRGRRTPGALELCGDSKVKLEACNECSLKSECPGVDISYLRLHGDKGIEPIRLLSIP